jgi:hypothetical protein
MDERGKLICKCFAFCFAYGAMTMCLFAFVCFRFTRFAFVLRSFDSPLILLPADWDIDVTYSYLQWYYGEGTRPQVLNVFNMFPECSLNVSSMFLRLRCPCGQVVCCVNLGAFFKCFLQLG